MRLKAAELMPTGQRSEIGPSPAEPSDRAEPSRVSPSSPRIPAQWRPLAAALSSLWRNGRSVASEQNKLALGSAPLGSARLASPRLDSVGRGVQRAARWPGRHRQPAAKRRGGEQREGRDVARRSADAHAVVAAAASECRVRQRGAPARRPAVGQ